MTLREELIDFFGHFREYGEQNIGMTIEDFVDDYLKNHHSSQPNGGDRVVNENEPQKEVCEHNMVPFGSDELDAGYYCTKCNYFI